MKITLVIMAMAYQVSIVLTQFDEQAPLIYLGTDHYVEQRRLIVDLAIAIANPCPRISLSRKYYPEIRDNTMDESNGHYTNPKVEDYEGFYPLPHTYSSNMDRRYTYFRGAADYVKNISYVYEYGNCYADIDPYAELKQHEERTKEELKITPNDVREVDVLYPYRLRYIEASQIAIDLGISNDDLCWPGELIASLTALRTKCNKLWSQLKTEITRFDSAPIVHKAYYENNHNQRPHKRTHKRTYKDLQYPEAPVKTTSEVHNKTVANATKTTTPPSKDETSPRIEDNMINTDKFDNLLLGENWHIRHFRKREAKRYKRGFWGAAAKLGLEALLSPVGGVVIANIATDLIKYAWESFTAPGNDRMESIKKGLATEITASKITTSALEKSIEATSILSKKTELMEAKWVLIRKNDLKVTALTDAINKGFEDAILALEQLTEAKSNGNVNTYAIKHLTGIAEFTKFPSRFTDITDSELNYIEGDFDKRVLNKSEAYVIHLQFNLHEVPQDTYVAKIKAFDHWDIANENLLHYIGKPYVVYNETNNCAKGIDMPETPLINEDCKERDYIDPELSSWQTIAHGDPRKIKLDPVRIHANKYSYVYCFPHNITVYNTTEICPPQLFRLPILSPFQIPATNVNWTPTSIKMQSDWKMDEKIYNSIHSQHFPTDSSADSSGRVAHLLLSAHADLRRKTELLDSIKLDEAQRGRTWMYGILYTLITSIVCAMVICTGYYCYKFQICYKVYMLVVADEIETAQDGSRRLSVSRRKDSKNRKRLEQLRQTQKNLQIMINTATQPRHGSAQSSQTQTSSLSPNYPSEGMEMEPFKKELEDVEKQIAAEEFRLAQAQAETAFINYPGLPSGSAPPTPR